jgi:hypothetical protein
MSEVMDEVDEGFDVGLLPYPADDGVVSVG